MAFRTAGQVAYGLKTVTTSGVQRRASAAASRAMRRYSLVSEPTGPTITATRGAQSETARTGAVANGIGPMATRVATRSDAMMLRSRVTVVRGTSGRR